MLFRKKCELVTTPVFDKFKNQVENQHYFIDIDKKSTLISLILNLEKTTR